MIDRLLWLGGDLAEVTCADLACGCERDIEAETVAVVTLRLENGALGTITGTTLAYDGMPQRVLICGTEGSAAFEGDALTFFNTRRPFCHRPATADPAAVVAGASDPLSIAHEGHLRNIRDFALAVREGRPPQVSAEDSRRVVRALNLIYAAAQVGRWSETSSRAAAAVALSAP